MGFDGDLVHRGRGEEGCQQLPNTQGLAGADVVDFSGFAALERKPVRSYDIANIAEIPRRVQVPHPEDGLLKALFNPGNLFAEVGLDEHFSSPRARMIECPRDHDVQAKGPMVLLPR